MSQITRNTHVVSRFLTKSWEYDQQRKLHFYDFHSGRIRTQSSRKLFAKQNLFDQELETFFDRIVENHSAQAIEKIVSGAVDLTDWNQYRATILLILLQATRFGAIKDGTDRLKGILKFDEPTLNTFVKALEEKFKLARINLKNDSRLYFPETGVFAYLVTDCGIQMDWAFALPVRPQTILTLMPIAMKLEEVEKMAFDQKLMVWSVGSSKSCNRVIIHSDLLDGNPEDKVIEHVLRCRKFVDGQIKLMNNFNNVIRKVGDQFP